MREAVLVSKTPDPIPDSQESEVVSESVVAQTAQDIAREIDPAPIEEIVDVDPSNREGGIYFPVEELPIHLDGFDANGWKAVVRSDTKRTICCHRRSYRLIKNEDVFPAFEEALRESALDTTDMSITDHISYGGAKSERRYKLPKHRIAIQRDDEVDLQLRVHNSYDGSTSIASMLGGWRLICDNGLVIGKRFAYNFGRHTLNVNVEKMAKELTVTLNLWKEAGEEWMSWVGKPVTEETAEVVFKAVPQATPRLVSQLMEYYKDEAARSGHTLWTIYNALTFWSTNGKVQTRAELNRASIQGEREVRVRQTLNSEPFRLAAH
jgi:hypothetical protein